MAEILVKLSDNDPSGKNPGAYRPGMPVVVRPDGWKWGKEERPPKFFVIKLPGVPVEAVEKYIEEHFVDTGLYAPNGDPIMAKGPTRKVWQFQINDLPTLAKSKLQSIGELTVSRLSVLDGKDIRWIDIREKLWNHKERRFETADL